MYLYYLSPAVFLINLAYRHITKIQQRGDLRQENVFRKVIGEFGVLLTGIQWDRNNIHVNLRPFVEKYSVEVVDLLYNTIINLDHDVLQDRINELPRELTKPITIYYNMPFLAPLTFFSVAYDLISAPILKPYIHGIYFLAFSNSSSPLLINIANNNFKAVKTALNDAAKNNQLVDIVTSIDRSGYSPLTYAIEYELEGLNIILDTAAQNNKLVDVLNFEDGYGAILKCTPVNNIKALKIILDTAAQNNKLVDVLNFEGKEYITILQSAIVNNKSEALEIILNIAAKNNKLGEVLNFKNKYSDAIFKYIAQNNKLEEIKIVLDNVIKNNKLEIIDILHLNTAKASSNGDSISHTSDASSTISLNEERFTPTDENLSAANNDCINSINCAGLDMNYASNSN